MSEAQAVSERLALLRKPFPPNQISKLPKPYKKDSPKGKCPECGGFHGLPAVHLDYVGHAALTDRLLDTDPAWHWEPMSLTEEALPRFDKSGGLWIRLTICGVTRLGYGHAAVTEYGDPGKREKEIIGDALRNAAMRFGAALDLWHKGDLHADDDASPEGAQPAADKTYPSPVTSALEGETFTKEQIAMLNRTASSLVDLCTLATEGEDVDYKIWELMEPLEMGERLYLWQLLKPQSKVRTRVKAVVLEHQHKKTTAPA